MCNHLLSEWRGTLATTLRMQMRLRLHDKRQRDDKHPQTYFFVLMSVLFDATMSSLVIVENQLLGSIIPRKGSPEGQVMYRRIGKARSHMMAKHTSVGDKAAEIASALGAEGAAWTSASSF
jgi:hypothetical protein